MRAWVALFLDFLPMAVDLCWPAVLLLCSRDEGCGRLSSLYPLSAAATAQLSRAGHLQLLQGLRVHNHVPHDAYELVLPNMANYALCASVVTY